MGERVIFVSQFYYFLSTQTGLYSPTTFYTCTKLVILFSQVNIMINAPSTPTTPTPDAQQHPFFSVDQETQLEALFSILNITDNPESIKLLSILDHTTNQMVKFITITSGKNAGEKRQVYRDANGKAYYKLISDRNHVRRIYLEEYIDNDGEVRHPNASMTMVKQYKKLVQDSIQPTALFTEAAGEEKESPDDDVSVISDNIIVKEEKDVSI